MRELDGCEAPHAHSSGIGALSSALATTAVEHSSGAIESEYRGTRAVAVEIAFCRHLRLRRRAGALGLERVLVALRLDDV